MRPLAVPLLAVPLLLLVPLLCRFRSVAVFCFLHRSLPPLLPGQPYEVRVVWNNRAEANTIGLLTETTCAQ